MTPAELIAKLRADVADYSEAELADVANTYSILFGQRYVQTPEEAARALIGGLPPALQALGPAGRERAKRTLLTALEGTHE